MVAPFEIEMGSYIPYLMQTTEKYLMNGRCLQLDMQDSKSFPFPRVGFSAVDFHSLSSSLKQYDNSIFIRRSTSEISDHLKPSSRCNSSFSNISSKAHGKSNTLIKSLILNRFPPLLNLYPTILSNSLTVSV